MAYGTEIRTAFTEESVVLSVVCLQQEDRRTLHAVAETAWPYLYAVHRADGPLGA